MAQSTIWERKTPAPIYTPPAGARKRSRAHYLMFAFLALVLVISALAIYNRVAPALKEVPNTVETGLAQDRVNIVLIGIGGDKHPGRGKNLADAIMVLSLKPSTRQAAMISIPRDYYVSMGQYGMNRINAAHALGEDGYPGGGPALVMDSANIVLKQPMHAYVRVDFAAFQKIIDELGGVDIYVHRPFYDFLFKDSFKQGWQHMNGERALRYARYRYINSEEGNNYARELRQQQVLDAIRDKLRKLSVQQALQLVSVARTVSKHSSTNLTTGQMIHLYSVYRDMKKNQVRHVSLAPFTHAVKTNDPADPTPAVGPRAGNNNRIQAMARDVFLDTKPIVTETQIQVGRDPVPPPPAK
jgi:LCP family protein required for cell wall assembly